MRFTIWSLTLTRSFRHKALTIKQFTTSLNRFAKPPTTLLSLSSLVEESNHIQAREWVNNFKVNDIPKESYEISRSRSSGPGGQHVNKTESKVTLRLDLSKAKGNWLPNFIFKPLIKSPYYISNPPSILITSQTSRTASQNLSTVLNNLHQVIIQSANQVIINPTSIEQKNKVKNYIKKENEKRIELKKRNSAKKASRREVD
ncbi:uncharacterized protein I206_103016 [Kwoniella pini CBS 10737]|uniref:Peptidyl-tRNA hydrolase ICT1 n=1 Tax=Kwoniella pini CBS 10737 TaxID=1296096 RepID=A0A1B9IAP0_9TREE|nr:peptidyl-tRNA hydrolase ICT1 [Kwoniella pini CBS 10737]OCF52685.1 peptidyl-tRNA hydrolase ICT1 [Kwoniella pini CBS 10737]